MDGDGHRHSQSGCNELTVAQYNGKEKRRQIKVDEELQKGERIMAPNVWRRKRGTVR